MDLFFFHKTEKGLSPNLLQIFPKFFRFLELCFLLLFLSWSLSRLPIALTISADFFRKLFGFLASPLFGFLLCNAIIFTLLAKPTKFSDRSAVSVVHGDEIDRIYAVLMGKSGSDGVHERKVEIVYQDKQIIAEPISSIDHKIEERNADTESESGVDHPKVILRTLSEKLKPKTQREKLRRSETEKCRHLEHSHDILYYQDDLSSEEFQRKIEAFIAKEKKFRREESSAIVLH